MSNGTPLAYARDLHQRGFAVIPVPFKEKKPRLKGWQNLRVGESDLARYFDGVSGNVGILLGEPSRWMIDIDLDHPLAVELAPSFLPHTGAVFGRKSRQRSHWLYRLTAPAKSRKWKTKDGDMILELRSTGCQTVAPGSTHPSGEAVRWDEHGAAASVAPEELRLACERLAAEVRARLDSSATAESPSPTSEAATPGEAAASDDPLQRFLSRLECVSPQGDQYQARCPAHPDKTPSLSIARGGDGRVLIHCHAGCDNEAIVAAVGLTMADMFAHSVKKASSAARRALSAGVARVESAEGDSRKKTLVAASFAAGKLVGEGTLEASEAVAALSGAALKCGLSEEAASELISGNLDAGRSLAEAVTAKSRRRIGAITLVAESVCDDRIVVIALDDEGKEIARDKVDPNSSRSRSSFARSVVSAVETDTPDTKALDAALRELKPPTEADPSDGGKSGLEELLAQRDEQRQALLDEMPPDIVREAEAMLMDPRLIDRIAADIEALGLVGETVLGITLYVQGTSRLLAKPLSIIIQGTSSSGKSFTIEVVVWCFPPEAVVKATDITPNALYYMEAGRMIHCWIVAGERSRDESPEKAEGKRALREMISSGVLNKAIPIKQPDGGFITKILHQDGPIAFVESTTSTRLFDEDSNRCMLLSTDETPEQTARIVAAAAAAAEGTSAKPERVVLVHHALQRQLRRVNVRIPFAGQIAKFVPSTRPEARRAIGHIFSVIRAVALLYQRQRKQGQIRDGDTIDATIDDYVIARRLLEGPLGRALGGSVPDAVARFGQRLKESYKAEEFTSTRACEDDKIITSKGKVNEYLRALADAGVVECVDDNRGAKPKIWKVVGEVPKPGAAWLPTVEQLREGAA